MRKGWWRAGIVVIALAALVPLLFALYRSEERRHKLAEIQAGIHAVAAREADLKARFDALNAESATAANDPDRLRVLGARRLGLIKENEALKKDLDRLQHDLDAAKR